MSTDRGPWLQTYTGTAFYPFDPRPEDINLTDIAHHLSNTCRFGGAVSRFYSVAQHSFLVASVLDGPYKMQGLLHDASEAYLGDIIRAIKYHKMFDLYRSVEQRLEEVIAERFNLRYPFPPEIHEIDNRLLITEARDLMAAPPMPWEVEAQPFDWYITPWAPGVARGEFLTLAEKLGLK